MSNKSRLVTTYMEKAKILKVIFASILVTALHTAFKQKIQKVRAVGWDVIQRDLGRAQVKIIRFNKSK